MSTATDPIIAGLKAADEASAGSQKLRYVDVGINLGDPVFRGIYHGKRAHDDDFELVLQRALEAGCRKFMVTGSDLTESEHAIELAKAHPGFCYATIGLHPCSAHQLDSHPASSGGATGYLSALQHLATGARVTGHAVAFGEIGLDYDRLYLSTREAQLSAFDRQLDVAAALGLPLFLHMRNAMEDFERVLRSSGEGEGEGDARQQPDGSKKDRSSDDNDGGGGDGGGNGGRKSESRWAQLQRHGGLVHSFTGSSDELARVLALGFDVGVNGCSLKTEENVEVVQQIPLARLQLETDGPWCEMRPSHAAARFLEGAPALPRAVKKEKWSKECMVKGRNEPCAIAQVAWAVAEIKGVPVEEVCEAAWNNSVRMFGLGETLEP
ncbi:MAG: hypothetical protein M1821_006210 [Bathelium mastoideum]|nr:MAG: hypothetical protein M1821_006210 [Bathelium mastoideum]KAI9686549.1 MAG: hypothetical protein M1822_003560 [Bathelium mastoideum]